eukprot:Nk52_evm3s1810 gene=Nk52_evmTU3s1810
MEVDNQVQGYGQQPQGGMVPSFQPIQIKGKLIVSVIEATGLFSESNPHMCQPYCVLEYERVQAMTKIENGFRPSWQESFIFDCVHEAGELTLTVWDRGVVSDNDFLGFIKIMPNHIDGKVSDNWYKLTSRQHKDHAKGEVHLAFCFKAAPKNCAISLEDFDLLRVLGKGSFGKVMQVKKKDTGQLYAMKILRKAQLVERDEVEHTRSERQILAEIKCPFLVSMKFCFQTPSKIYMVLDYVHGGELFYHLQQEGRFHPSRAKFYSAELILALEYLHSLNVIYRDLKPENVLLDYNGHVVLTDFGLSKRGTGYDSKTKTFCGTAEYLAPEVLKGEGYGKEVDWWSLGVLLYEMLTGLPPFYSENTNTMYKLILYQDISFPEYVTPDAANILFLMLQRNPDARLGAGPYDAEPIKSHIFFQEVNWDALLKKRIQPPYKPRLHSATDTSNFDPEFTSQKPNDSYAADTHLSTTMQQQFQGFSYVDENAMQNNM